MQDNVQYLEFRTVLPGLCPDMDGCANPTSAIETAKIFKQVADQFVQDHPDDFCGVKMIYAPSRFVLSTVVSDYLDIALQLPDEVGDFYLGFDLVGQEDKGRPLIEFAQNILEKTEGKDVKFFFHAGETDWQGQSTDANILDALLLNTTRIGHGYAIAKHPEAKRLALEHQVPIGKYRTIEKVAATTAVWGMFKRDS
jgi:adenosine deaminase CECR1